MGEKQPAFSLPMLHHFEQSMQQCYLPGQSHIHILRNSAHMGMLEEAAKINEAIQRFLNAF